MRTGSLCSGFHVIGQTATEKARRPYMNLFGTTAEQTDDWQQNEDDVLRQSQRLGCSVLLYRPDSDAWTYRDCTWCAHVMVGYIRASDLRLSGCGFDSRPGRYQVTTVATGASPCASVTKQHILVPNKEHWPRVTDLVLYAPTGSYWPPQGYEHQAWVDRRLSG